MPVSSTGRCRRQRGKKRQFELHRPASGGAPRRRRRSDKPGARVPHTRRPRLDPRHPVHITTRIEPDVAYLRGFRIYPAVRDALWRARERLGTRIVHFSVQSRHLHLIVESRDRVALGRAMKGFGVRLARRLNRIAGRRGRVIADRYHARHLRGPLEVRRALVYVLQNSTKHAYVAGPAARATLRVDPFSSSAFFTGWAKRCRRWIPARDAPAHPLHRWAPRCPVASPGTWLLREGWLRAGGPIDTDERPAPDATVEQEPRSRGRLRSIRGPRRDPGIRRR
jgi:REP element-mobilizing transposase RayT